MAEIINEELYSHDTLWSMTQRVKRKMKISCFDRAKRLREEINDELYKSANKGYDYCLIFLNMHIPDDTCGYIADELINILKKEGFKTSYHKSTTALWIKWDKEEKE